MADLDAMLKQLAEVSDVIHSLDADRERALVRREELIRSASRAGATYVTIREITGMSPSTISKALKGRS